jgi:ATP-dependent DNA helicase DinG
MNHVRTVRRGGYDFQVLNHNMFLADLLRRSKNQQPLIPDYQA